MSSPFLSIVIPAYNEERRLPETLAILKDFVDEQEYETEVLVVDDGSTDGTVAVVKKAMRRFPQLRLIENAQNKGKGGVVRQGMLEARGEYRLFTDADNSTPITELPKLLAHIPAYDVVIGSRYLEKGSIKIKQPLKRRILSRSSNWLIRHTVLPGIKDTQCGFKLFSAAAAQQVFSQQSTEGWLFDVEVLTIAHTLGLKIREVPVEWFDAKRSTIRASRAAVSSLKELQQIRGRVRGAQYRRQENHG